MSVIERVLLGCIHVAALTAARRRRDRRFWEMVLDLEGALVDRGVAIRPRPR